MNRPVPAPGATQKGVALVLLLWLVAALTLLVSGLALTAKTDIRTAQLQMLQAQVAAAADGSALIYLSQMGQYTEDGQPLPPRVQMGDWDVHLRIVPGRGLIDYRQASEALLLELFITGANLPPGDAAMLVESVLQWRAPELDVSPHRVSGQAVGINVLEDIMAAPGMTREIFERIRPLITINGAGSQVDVSWAPVEVLDIVAASGELLDVNVEILLEERRENPTMPTLQGDFRVDARVQTPIGILQRSLWMASGGTAGVGWQVKRKWPVTGVASLDFDGLIYGEQ